MEGNLRGQPRRRCGDVRICVHVGDMLCARAPLRHSEARIQASGLEQRVPRPRVAGLPHLATELRLAARVARRHSHTLCPPRGRLLAAGRCHLASWHEPVPAGTRSCCVWVCTRSCSACLVSFVLTPIEKTVVKRKKRRLRYWNPFSPFPELSPLMFLSPGNEVDRRNHPSTPFWGGSWRQIWA